MRYVNARDLVLMAEFEKQFPIEIDLVYSQPDHANNHFGSVYSKKAKLWCHKDIAKITLLAAKKLEEHCGWKLRIFDCLRTIEAQEIMANKGFDSSLVSLPGSGAHPRAMAIDVQPVDRCRNLVDMGTPFDHFANDLTDNPAARNYTKFISCAEAFEYRSKRSTLETAFRWAATKLNLKMLPLPQEWWDFRLDESIWTQFAPINENSLPDYMRLIETRNTPPKDQTASAASELIKSISDFL